jgi:hypothetical protein
MKILTGHLTSGNKNAIMAILNHNLTEGKVGITNYFLTKQDGIYTVSIIKSDRGLIPCPGSELRKRMSIVTFKF